jgi:hypothetical protein
MAFVHRAMRIAWSAAAAGACGIAAVPAQAADWYFYVQNNSSSRITRLEAKEKGGGWGAFDLGGGIAAGEKVRLDWSASTNDQDCKQSLRASFADGSVSDPTVFDFCADLDTPIVFSD